MPKSVAQLATQSKRKTRVCVCVCHMPPPLPHNRHSACCCNAAARGYGVAVELVGTAARGTFSVAHIGRRGPHARAAQRGQL
eukprot:363927-Chlamydomonas_euryale.AAC.3